MPVIPAPMITLYCVVVAKPKAASSVANADPIPPDEPGPSQPGVPGKMLVLVVVCSTPSRMILYTGPAVIVNSIVG